MSENFDPWEGFGVRVKRRREQLGLSRNALAVKMGGGRDARHLQRIESGQRHNPRLVTLVRLTRALGCSLDWLVLGRKT